MNQEAEVLISRSAHAMGNYFLAVGNIGGPMGPPKPYAMLETLKKATEFLGAFSFVGEGVGSLLFALRMPM